MYIIPIWLNLLFHSSQGTLCFLFPGGVSGKESTSNAGDVRDMGLIPGLGRSPTGGHRNLLQYSYLENPMERGAWWATVHGVANSWTQMKWLSTHSCIIYVDIILHSVNVVCDVCWFTYEEPFLHPRNNSHLIMVWIFTCATGFGLQVFFLRISAYIFIMNIGL